MTPSGASPMSMLLCTLTMATGKGLVPKHDRRTSKAFGSTSTGCHRIRLWPTLARQRGLHPAEAMIELCVASNGDQLFIQPSLYPQDEAMLLRALRHPRAVMTFSDSGAHLSQIADSSIHTHLLGYWVRDRQEFTLEEAVRMITLAPALAWGFDDRGLLRPGMAADINVFDPATVGPAVPSAGDGPSRRGAATRAAVPRVLRHLGERPSHHSQRAPHRGCPRSPLAGFAAQMPPNASRVFVSLGA